jgi:ethanolamine utilization microcompartment shell protein EutL
MKVIPNVDPALAKELSLKPEHRSLGIVTSDCDDVTYVEKSSFIQLLLNQYQIFSCLTFF